MSRAALVVPSLRNAALTASYMHDGQLPTLADVVNHYGERILEPLHLSAGERVDVIAFLESLSDPLATVAAAA